MDTKPELPPEQEEWCSLSSVEIDPDHSLPDTERTVKLRALVLASRNIPGRIEHDQSGWQLLVPADRLADAVSELRLFHAENRNWPPPQPAYRTMPDNTLATMSVLFLLASFHNITRLNSSLFGHAPPDWVYIGSAKVHLIQYGEWWRLVTALTLHADWLHLLSNLTIGGFFVVALCRELGSGLAWFLLLAAGSIGNWINAQVQFPTHSSVGGSTAVFAAVGILAALNLVRHRISRQGRWKQVIAAALALLALLGTEGRNTDLGAHLFGFMAGVVLGILTEYLITVKGTPGNPLNLLLAVMSWLIVIAAWWAAVTGSGG